MNIIPNIKNKKIIDERKKFTLNHVNFYTINGFDSDFIRRVKKIFLELSNFWQARWVEKKLIREGEEITTEIVVNFKKMEKEKYEIKFYKKNIIISVSDFSGFSNSLSSIYQIQLNNDFFIESEIIDYPNYKWRGTLIDTSRHFLRTEHIKKIILIQWLYKQNVMHWHISDDQGWRLALDSLPNLSERSSFRYKKSLNRGTYGGYYRKSEIKEIIDYASIFNINIMPEIDIPGHCEAIVFAYNELICDNKKPNHIRKENGISENVLCLGNPKTNIIIKKIIDEVVELFPFEYIHLGGDEAPTENWKNCMKCKDYMKKNNINSIASLQNDFMLKWKKYLSAKNKKVIFYDDIMEENPIENITINFWRDWTINNYKEIGIENIINYYAEQKIEIILNSNKYTYFDHGSQALSWKKGINGSWINTLENSYEYSIKSFIKKSLKNKIIGSECSLWSEEIRSLEDLTKSWIPRLLSFQEELWGGKTEFNDFKNRAGKHKELFKNINIKISEI